MVWDENKHPRDSIGRFTFKDKLEEFDRIYSSDPKIYEHNTSYGDIIRLPDEQLPRSIGAKWGNYDIMDLRTGDKYHFVEGSKLQNIEVFCGFGTRKIYHKAYKYSDRLGGTPEEWQHVKGFGVIDTPEGHKRAEVHWSQHKVLGKHDFFIKRWLE